jgi:hypothetical protein
MPDVLSEETVGPLADSKSLFKTSVMLLATLVHVLLCMCGVYVCISYLRTRDSLFLMHGQHTLVHASTHTKYVLHTQAQIHTSLTPPSDPNLSQSLCPTIVMQNTLHTHSLTHTNAHKHTSLTPPSDPNLSQSLCPTIVNCLSSRCGRGTGPCATMTLFQYSVAPEAECVTVTRTHSLIGKT